MGRYTGDRPELLRLVTDTPRTVLDVGCGAGAFAELLRSRGVERITGIEPDPGRSVKAATRVDRLLATTVEDALERELEDSTFDLIVAADVLEHLVDPWTVTARLATRLAPGGRLLISLPNVGSLEVVKQLVLRGDWRYDDDGIFDRTHLRWFGRRTLRSMLADAGLAPIRWGARLAFGIGPLYTTRLVDDASRLPSITIFQHHVLAGRI